jgi:hypothetical protein
MPIKKTITLLDCSNHPSILSGDKRVYRVESMQNTVRYKIGEYITKDEVETLISQKYTVNVKERKYSS